MIVTSYRALAATQLETSGEYVCNESPTIYHLTCCFAVIRQLCIMVLYQFIGNVYFLTVCLYI